MIFLFFTCKKEMMTMVVLICGALLLAEHVSNVTGLPSSDEWEKFKASYGKVYKASEDEKR